MDYTITLTTDQATTLARYTDEHNARMARVGVQAALTPAEFLRQELVLAPLQVKAAHYADEQRVYEAATIEKFSAEDKATFDALCAKYHIA